MIASVAACALIGAGVLELGHRRPSAAFRAPAPRTASGQGAGLGATSWRRRPLPGGIEFAVGATLDQFQNAYQDAACTQTRRETLCETAEEVPQFLDIDGRIYRGAAISFRDRKADSFIAKDVDADLWKRMIEGVAARYGPARITNDATYAPLGMTSTSFDWIIAGDAFSFIHLQGRRAADGAPFEMHGILFRPATSTPHPFVEDASAQPLIND
jgi:hypothetical protein